MQGVKNVTENQPVDNVQEDEGRGEEDPGHAILKISRSHLRKKNVVCILEYYHRI